MEAIYTKVYEVFNNAANQQTLINMGFEPIKTIDKFRGQTTNPEAFEVYELPALFISCRTKWKQEGKRQIGDVAIDFHLVQDLPMEAGSIYTSYQEGLKQLHYFKAVQQFLDGLQTTETTKLQRLEDSDIDTGVVCYTLLSYTCQTYEAIGTTNSILVDDVEVEIIGKGLVNKI
jgi:hypothetical protein